MTDFISLGVGLDATKMQTGARSATNALDSVSAKAEATSTTTRTLQSNLDKTLTVSGSSLGLAGALTTTALAAKDANIAIVALGTAQIFREAGNVVKDFGELAQETKAVTVATTAATTATNLYTGAQTSSIAATAAAGTATRSLWGIMAANPLGIIITALGLVSAAIITFTGNTVKAKSEFQSFIDETDRLTTKARVAKDFGLEDVAKQATRNQQSRLFDFAVDIETRKKPISAEDFAKGQGISLEELKYQLEQISPRDPVTGRADIGSVVNYSQAPILSPALRSEQADQLEFLRQRDLSSGKYTIGSDTATRVLSNRSRELGNQFASEDIAASEGGDPYVLAAVKQTDASADYLAKLNEGMDAINVKAEQLASTLADGALDFLTGAREGGDILKSIALDFARQGLQKSLAGALGSIGQSAFGSSPSTAPSSTGFTQPLGTNTVLR